MVLSRWIEWLLKSAGSLSRLIRISWIAITLITVFIISILWIILRINVYVSDLYEIESKYINLRDEKLEAEVTRIIDYINYAISINDRRSKALLKSRCNEAHEVISDLYAVYGHRMGEMDFRNLVKTVLGGINYNNGRSFFFIIDESGNIILYPSEKQLENTNNRNNKLIKSIIDFAVANKAGFMNYRLQASDNSYVDKIAYVKVFNEKKWIIATSDYHDSNLENLQREILERISLLRIGSNQHISVYSFDGLILWDPISRELVGSNQWEMTDKNGVKVMQQYKRVIDSLRSGMVSFLWYNNEKSRNIGYISYVTAYEPWKWMIVASQPLGEEDARISKLRGRLVINLLLELLLLMGIALVIIFIIIRASKSVSRKISQTFTELDTFFTKAARQNIEIDESRIYFDEFKMLAVTAGEMIKERQKMEDAYRTEKAYFEQLLQNSPEALVLCDLTSHILLVNKEFENLFGYNRDELYGRVIDTFLASGNKIDEAMGITQKIAVGNSIKIETSRMHKSGAMIDVLLIGTPVYIDGIQVGTFGLYRDISEQKAIERNLKVALEKAEEASKLKDAFLSNMSHEIRTPMNAILGFSNLLKLPSLSPTERNDYLQLIVKSGLSLMRLIDDIMDLSKIESGHLIMRLSNIKIGSFLEEIFQQFNEEKEKSAKSQIEMKLNIESTIRNLVIESDEYRLKQILSNLLNNALKFTEKGFVELGCELGMQNQIRFYVKDTGIGFDPAYRDIIFERFRQANNSLTRLYGGTGLGLAITKSLVELLGGHIHCDSEPGKGSIFIFELPYQAPAYAIKTEVETSTLHQVNLTDKIIMIAEDTDTNFVYLDFLLKQLNAYVIRARNGAEAVEYVRSGKNVDAILMDIQMPVMSGYEATKILKQIKPELPVIAQTAFAFDEEREFCMQAGCDDYLTKPITQYKLMVALCRFF